MNVATAVANLVVANRILADKGVLDSFGHVSVRHPENPQRYLMSRSRAPRLITQNDICEFSLDSTPIDDRGFRMYGERPIHGCIYQARPDVIAVCHNHAHSLLPFAVAKIPMSPAIHMASVIGPEVPVWDIRDGFGDTSMLVTTNDMGRSLAAFLGNRRAALMRGHGSVIVGASIPEVVFIAYYLQLNAEVLLHSKILGNIHYLSQQEVHMAAAINLAPLAIERAWEDWSAQVSSPESSSP